MTLRAFLARSVLLVLCAVQLALLAGFIAALLMQPTAPNLAALVRQSLAGPEGLAIASAVAAAILPGTLAAMALWRMRLSGLAAGLLLAPLLLPIALFGFDDGPRALTIFLLAHAGLGLGLGTLCGIACLAWLDLGVLNAAACSGVSPWGTMRRVVLPVMAPGILAATLLAATIPLALAMLRTALGLHALVIALPAQPKIIALAAIGLAITLTAIASAAAILLRRP
jgi:ABC-type spermidine/putrescine transport system permease subunit II